MNFNLHKNFIKICFLFIYFSLSATLYQVNAQILENRLNIYLGFADRSINGDQWINQDGFITPSFFPGFKQNRGIQFTGTYKLKPWLAPGLFLNLSNSQDWVNDESILYRDAGSDFIFIAPAIRFYSPRTSLGFLNRFSVFAELAAGVGQARIELGRPIISIGNGSNVESPMTESASYWGMTARVGAKFDINHMGGLHFSYSLHRNRIDGALFIDRNLDLSQFEVGIHFRFLENKRFYY